MKFRREASAGVYLPRTGAAVLALGREVLAKAAHAIWVEVWTGMGDVVYTAGILRASALKTRGPFQPPK
jgi:pantoate kinase